MTFFLFAHPFHLHVTISMPLASVIALLTDFGVSDQYVGTMKGVILSTAPHAHLVDISHDVSPQNVVQAGYLLWASYKYFPEGSIFVCVVDPGVGSNRRIVCVKASQYFFLAPDNGLLNFVLREENVKEAIEVRVVGRVIHGLPGVHVAGDSSTFHGRDILAPVAAALSQGKSWSPDAPRTILDVPAPQFVDSKNPKVTARILHIDSFGNLITNIRIGAKEEIKNFAPALRPRTGIRIGRTRIGTWISNYAEAPAKKACLILGSSGLVEIVAKNSSAQKLLRATLSTPITIARK